MGVARRFEYKSSIIGPGGICDAGHIIDAEADDGWELLQLIQLHGNGLLAVYERPVLEPLYLEDDEP